MLSIKLKMKTPERPFGLTQEDKEQLDKFNDARGEVELSSLLYKYGVGQYVAAHLKGNEGRYKEVLERIAERLPHHPSTLRTRAEVAMLFTESEFHHLIRRKTSRGNRLYWTHFGHLARVRDRSVREQLIEDVFKHDLRTTELRERIRAWEGDNWLLQIGGPSTDGTAVPSLQEDLPTADEIMTTPFRRSVDCDHGTVAGAV